MILRAKNITAKQFAEEIGIQPSGMSHIMGGRNNPSLDFVGKVLRRYPEIDANWLLLGRGQMYGSVPAPAPAVESFPTAEPTLFGDDAAEPAASDDSHAAVAPQVVPPIVPADAAAAAIPPVPYTDEVPPTPAAAEPAARYAPAYIAVPPEPAPPAGHCDDTPHETRKVVRMLLVYSDNTFEEYRPK